MSALNNMRHATIATWVEFFLGMLVSIIIARALQPDVFGHYSFLIWCAMLFVIAANGGLTTAAIKFVAEASPGPDRGATVQFLSSLQRRFLLAATCIASGLIALLLLSGSDDTPAWLWGLLLLAAALKSSYQFRNAISKGRENFAAIARVVLIVGPANLLLCLAIAWRYPTLESFVLAYAVTSSLYLLCMRLFEQHDPGRNSLTIETRSRMWRHIRIVSVSIVLSFLILRQSEVLFLKMLRPVEEIGFFNIAFTISFALSALIPGVYGSLLLPMMSRESRSEREQQGKQFHSAVRYLQLLALPMAAGTYVLGGLLIGLLYGDEYSTAADVLMWLITGVSLAAVGQASVGHLVSSDRQHTVLLVNAVTTALVLVIDWWAISHYGLTGAGMAFLVGNLIHAGAMTTLAMRRLAIHWQWQVSARIIIATSMAAAASWSTVSMTESLLPDIATLLAGAVTFTLVYAASTLIVGCWDDEEKKVIRTLLQRGNRKG